MWLMLKWYLHIHLNRFFFSMLELVSPSSYSFSSNMSDDIFFGLNIFGKKKTTNWQPTFVFFLLSFLRLFKICIFIIIVITSSLDSLSSQPCGLMQIMFNCSYFVHTPSSTASGLFSFSTKGEVQPKFTVFIYLRRISALTEALVTFR